MNVGLLYESDEWSDYKLAAELQRALQEVMPDQTHAVTMIDMTSDDCIAEALACDALVSRVFASSVFRNHESALANMNALIGALADRPILLINEPRAHEYEVDKLRAARTLQEAGIAVPRIFICDAPDAIDAETLPYPCIIKPNCGGRTTCTVIAADAAEAEAFLATAPDIAFIVEEYVLPERGYLTRVEIVDGKAVLTVKRSVADNGLSAYHLGSTYEVIPNPPAQLVDEAQRAADALGFMLGSFDIIETDRGAFFIDANSVSNVSEDCTELFGIDLMRLHAESIADRLATAQGNPNA